MSDSEFDDTIRTKESHSQLVRTDSSSSYSSYSLDGSDDNSIPRPLMIDRLEIEVIEKGTFELDLDGKYEVTSYDEFIEDNCYVVAVEKKSGIKVGIRSVGEVSYHCLGDYWELVEEYKKFFKSDFMKNFYRLKHRHISSINFKTKNIDGEQNISNLFNESEPRYYFISDHFKYGSIESILSKTKKEISGEKHFFEKEVAVVVKSILLALRYLHRNNIVHLNVRTENFRIMHDGCLKLDLINSNCIESFKDWESRTAATLFVGHSYWTSPEVAEEACKNEKVGKEREKRDIWSLGISILEMTNGSVPFKEMNPVRVLYKIVKSNSSPKFDNPTMWSREMNDFLTVCLERDPSERPNPLPNY